MKLDRLFRRDRSARRGRRPGGTRVAQGAVLTLVTGTVAVLALSYEGAPIHDVELNDGGVWVTNADLGLLGRLNSQIDQLDLAVVTTTTSNTVFQQAGDVQVYDDGGSAQSTTRGLTVVDVISGFPVTIPLEGDYEAAAAGSTVAILDNESGNLWVRRTDQLQGFNGGVTPDGTVSPNSTVAVTQGGTALVADRSAGVVQTWRIDDTGGAVEGEPVDLETEFLDDAVLTAVGETPVVLQAGKLYRPGADAVTIDGEVVVVQPVGPEAEDVYLASETGLWRAAVGGGDAEQISDLDVDGNPARPVYLDGCVHAAWNDPGTDNYLRVCDGADDFSGEIVDLSSESALAFRTNRDVVVLNDITDGTMWMVQEPGLTKIDDWDSVSPNADDPQKAEADDEQHQDSSNDPPTANDDAFGARPGATVVLPVTLNDVDPDGDILVVTEPPAVQGETSFSLVGDGTQVQARVAANASGSIKFKYKITDGQPGNPPSEATVTLKIVDDDTDNPPVPIEDQEIGLSVADGYQASVNVLPAFIDPEGDSVVLVGATSEDGRVGYRPDGTIDFADDGRGTGTEAVEFTLAGGKEEKSYTLPITVLDPEEAGPTTVADHASGAVGSRILLEPLVNDIDPLGGAMSLARVTNVTNKPAQVTTDGRGAAYFKAEQPGSYYLNYVTNASNGVAADPQVIRVDVAPLTGTNKAPVAMRDIAAVRPGGAALVDVLANDTDPDGDVLVVQGIRYDETKWAGTLAVSLVNKRFVRVETVADLEGRQPVIEYTLSDGRNSTTGAVAVTAAETDDNRPPIAVEDVVTARAGTVIEIPVLDNDKDPDGDRMTVSQQDLSDIGDGTLIKDRKVPIIASGRTVRVLVPDDGTTQLQFAYGARDPEAGRGDSRVVINIQPDDPDLNAKPQPQPVEDRTVVGQKIRVSIDTFGADPDGDPVVYSGLVQPPRLGRIVAAGTNWFEYEPLEGDRNTGTDEFKVLVSDQYGLTGTADIRIGVAEPALENQAPAALSDDLVVKPGLTVQYPVLANDSDPDGDPLILDESGLHPANGTSARLVGTSIEVDVPEADGQREVTSAVQYEISDGLGASAFAILTVVARDDAPDYAPTAQDDVVAAHELRDKSEGDTVDVDVLANDGDIDGSRDDLTVEPVQPNAATVVGDKLRVTLKAASQVIPYRITDATDQFSFGFVYVTGTEKMPPILDTTAVPLEVTAGEEETFQLDEIVVVRPGHSPHLGNTNRIDQTNGDATPKGDDAFTWKSPADYWGPASVTLPVIDEEKLNTPGVLESQITIPITVLPAENVAPEVRNTAVTLFAAGDPVVVHLGRLASDPNPSDVLEFELGKLPTGVSADIDDDLLVFRADEDAPTADEMVALAVSDGEADPVEARIRVAVIGGSGEDEEDPKEPMTLREITVEDAEVGDPVEVDVRDAVLFDPFPDDPESIVSATVSSGSANVSELGDTRLRITPSDDGEVTVTYRLDDGSGDADRVVEGRVIVVVADVPDRPGAPRAVEGGPDSVQLTWTAPDNNGSDITHYLVEGTPDGSAECQATQCTVEGLEPGEDYRFTVVAVNEVGPSDPSPASTPVSPNTVPDAMAAPVVDSPPDDRNGKLHLTWSEPNNDGSAIEYYEIKISGIATPVKVTYPATDKTLDALENGTTYTFQIRAVNEEGEAVWSPHSKEWTPFTVPSRMAAPDLVATNDNGDGKGYMQVGWTDVVSPADGYDSVSDYEVRLIRSDGHVDTRNTGSGDVTIVDFNVENGYSYTAQVRAINQAGPSPDWSPDSIRQVSWDRAEAVTGIQNVDQCGGGRCRESTGSYFGVIAFTPPTQTGGYPVTSYRYISSGTPPEGVVVPAPSDNRLVVPFGNNAAGQTVTIIPITEPTDQGPKEGTAESASDSSPYALPFQPGGRTSGGYMSVSIDFDCTSPSNGAGPGAVSSASISADSGGTVNNTPSACTVTWSGITGGTQKCASVVVANGAGRSAASARICDHADARTVTPTYTSTPQTDKCYRPCYNIGYNVSGFAPGNYTATWKSYGSDFAECNGSTYDYARTFTVGNDGRASEVENWFISGTCRSNTVVSVKVDGITGEKNVP